MLTTTIDSAKKVADNPILNYIMVIKIASKVQNQLAIAESRLLF